MFKRKASLLGKERRWLFYGYKNHQEVDVILTIAPDPDSNRMWLGLGTEGASTCSSQQNSRGRLELNTLHLSLELKLHILHNVMLKMSLP